LRALEAMSRQRKAVRALEEAKAQEAEKEAARVAEEGPTDVE